MQQPRIFFAVALHEKYTLPTDALYTPIQRARRFIRRWG